MSDQSDLIHKMLSEIQYQLGQFSASLEALREDMKDGNDNSRSSRNEMQQKLDNLAVRTGKLEQLTKTTKATLDESVMPLVKAANERRLQVKGALWVWGVMIALFGGMATVFWSRLLTFVLWLIENHRLD